MARQQRNSTATHMIVAMGVLMVPIALIVAFFTRTPEPVVQHLDYAPVARLAAGEATFPVLVPAQMLFIIELENSSSSFFRTIFI